MREKKERNDLILLDIAKGEYLVDIAERYNISPQMVSKIKSRSLEKVEELKEKLKHETANGSR